jgi:hypothetical protein
LSNRKRERIGVLKAPLWGCRIGKGEESEYSKRPYGVVESEKGKNRSTQSAPMGLSNRKRRRIGVVIEPLYGGSRRSPPIRTALNGRFRFLVLSTAFLGQAGMISCFHEYSSSGIVYTRLFLLEHSVWGNDKEEKKWKY